MARVEEARGQRVEAHANGDAAAVKRALAAYQEAESAPEDTTLAAEGARVAADRAQVEVEKFKTEHADALIAELEPEAHAAAAQVTHSEVHSLRRHVG